MTSTTRSCCRRCRRGYPAGSEWICRPASPVATQAFGWSMSFPDRRSAGPHRSRRTSGCPKVPPKRLTSAVAAPSASTWMRPTRAAHWPGATSTPGPPSWMRGRGPSWSTPAAAPPSSAIIPTCWPTIRSILSKRGASPRYQGELERAFGYQYLSYIGQYRPMLERELSKLGQQPVAVK